MFDFSGHRRLCPDSEAIQEQQLHHVKDIEYSRIRTKYPQICREPYQNACFCIEAKILAIIYGANLRSTNQNTNLLYQVRLPET